MLLVTTPASFEIHIDYILQGLQVYHHGMPLLPSPTPLPPPSSNLMNMLRASDHLVFELEMAAVLLPIGMLLGILARAAVLVGSLCRGSTVPFFPL